jgi:hypothetical protein
VDKPHSFWPDWGPEIACAECGQQPLGPAALFQVRPRPEGSGDGNLAVSPHTAGINVALGDGSVRFVNQGISGATWWAALTPRGGEVLAGTLLAVDLANPGSGPPRSLLARVTHVTTHAQGEWLLGLALLRPVGEDELRAWGAESGPESRAAGDQLRGAAAAAAVTDPGLARLCSAWPALPEHIQAAILALAATAR